MGLTIHYTLRTSLTAAKDVGVLVRSLRDAANKLPFKDVGPVREFRDAEADFTHSGRDDPHRWLKIQAAQYRELEGRDYKVSPTHIIAFTVQPGDGCEPANLGFCRYPAHVTATGAGHGRPLPTHLDGWSWTSFCKTQYASEVVFSYCTSKMCVAT